MRGRSEKKERPVPDNTPTPSQTVEKSAAVETRSAAQPSLRAAASPEPPETSNTRPELPQPVPGANIIGRGIYIKARQPYELKGFIVEPGREQLQTYTSRETKLIYWVPDNCIINDSPPTSDQSVSETVVEESWDRFGNELKLNVNAAAGNGLFSFDPTGVRTSDLRADNDSYYALRSAFIALWNLSLMSVPTVPTLEEDVKVLENDKGEPLDPLDPMNRLRYARIFEKYGSHYVKSVWVGGKASLAFVVAKSSRLSKEEIQSGIRASVGGMLKAESSTTETTISERFKSSSTCKVFGSGGNRIELAKLTSLTPQTYENWIESVNNNPQPIQLGLAGIWTLIEDVDKANALRTAYLQESSFTPLKAIIPFTSSLFFLKNEGVFEYNLKPKPGDPKTTRDPKSVKPLMDYLKQIPRLATFTRPDAAISLNGFDDSLSHVLYLFRHGECVRLDYGKSPPTVADDYPKAIAEDWPGVDFDRIDAALTVAPDKVYFFRGSEYIRVDVAKGGPRVIGSHDLIKNRWSGVTFDRIDTAIYWGNSKVYLFSGDQYIRYDMAIFKSDPGYPKFLQSNYVEDWEIFE
jgi:hypothetical protein